MTNPPLEHDVARRAALQVLEHPGADGVEVVITGSSAGLTRYARSQIIQNTVRDELRAYVRVHVDSRIGSATTNQLGAEHMKMAAARALEAARASLEDPDFPGLPNPDEVGRAAAVMRWDDATAATAPAERARVVGAIRKAAGSAKVAGYYETSAHAFAVFSSAGVDCYDAFTRCVVTCLVDLDDATGWGEASSPAAGEVDAEAAASRAVSKAQASAGAETAEPGTYEVVLEPAAVATLLDYLSYAGFGAKQTLEGESFLSSRSGQAVASPEVTVADDAWHPYSVGIGFDFEGVPKKRVAVIDRGTATGPVSDLRTARKLGIKSSGHYSGSGEFGPYASNVVLEEGTESLDALISQVDEGFLVTRFHYVNVLDRPSTLLTGMTRDGTFRISKGEVGPPVRNFRFAQSVLAALASVQGIGRDMFGFAPEFGSFGSTVAPALRVGEFRFASVTTH
jgi:PmbA protein